MKSALLFHGDDHDSILSKMRAHACEVLGVESIDSLMNHGDYQEVKPTSKSYLYSMETILKVVEESALPPYRGDTRIIALFAVDRMLPVHANALLKTLEDAPLSFHLLLTTTRYDDILKTILSRVQKLHVESVVQAHDFSEVILQTQACLQQSFFESFIKEIDSLEKVIIDPVEDAEKKLRFFLESYLKVMVKPFEGHHLYAANAKIIESQISYALKDFATNIRVKHILENLFLETQQQCYSTQSSV
ncbi:MAG: hypothetical protein S4CHLAM20_13630 [Chlamydiia bacterium]|nr:hypothetical protein [Chlamydiia bacterium]